MSYLCDTFHRLAHSIVLASAIVVILTNRLQEMLVLMKSIMPDSQLLSGWVNGNLYVQTTETSGILPVPPDICAQCGMQEYNELLGSKQPHRFLAAMQGTRKPILPVHSDEEKKLFSKLMREHPGFNRVGTGPIWQEAVKIWN